MNPIRKIRRPSWKPRLKFPHKGKPRSTRGNSIRKEKLLCLSHKTKAAAGLQRSSRRLNRLPEWTDPKSYITKGGRHRLFGEDTSRLRERVYYRSKGRCEAPKHHYTCGGWADDFNGHLAHKQHGPNKTDTLAGTFWAYWACHLIEQHNPKPITVTKKSLRASA